jgi:hypothetical protein
MTNDSEILLSRDQLDNITKKARLEGTIGYITHLLDGIREKQYKTLEELSAHLQTDAEAAYGSLAPILVEELKHDGAECGLMIRHTQ